MKTKTVNVNELLPGMKIYGDVFNNLGLTIFNSGFVLTETAIAKLALYGINSVTVEIPDNINFNTENANNIESEYTKRVRQRPEFKDFSVVYEDNKEKTVNGINNVAEGKDISAQEISSIPDSVSQKLKTNKDLFEFLGNIPIDDVTYTHSLNVSLIAKTFGRWIGLDEKQVEDLAIAGMLHDVGKTKIPKEILDKPDRLTPEEFEEVKKHPIYSYRLAQKLNLNDNILKGILMHHERYNGSGYPTGAKGQQIHLFGRILAIADVFEAMTSTRAFRSKICPFKVLDLLEEESYINFDPAIIGKILDNIANSYVGNEIRLNTGQKGKIMFINQNKVARPIIEVDNSMFDLSKENKKKIYIEELI